MYLRRRGASLPPSSVFAVANYLSPVQIDSSATIVKSLSDQNRPPPAPPAVAASSPLPSSEFKFSDLSPQEARASLFLYLNKLLLSASPTSSRPDLPFQIRDALNNNNDNDNNNNLCLDVDGHDQILNLCATLLDLLNFVNFGPLQTPPLGQVVGFRRRHLCPPRPPVVGLVRPHRCRRRLVMRGLGWPSVRIRRDKPDDAVSGIPQVHGNFREIARSVRYSTRVELSFPVFTGAQGVFNTKALVKRFYALPNEFWDLGKDSWTRAKLNIDAMTSNADLRYVSSEMFDRECPRVDSVDGEEDCILGGNHGSGRGLGEKVGGDDTSSAEAEMVKGIESLKLNKKKSEKGKKVLGDDALSDEAEMVKGRGSLKPNRKKSKKGKKVLGEETVDPSLRALLEKWSRELLAFLDPKNSGFGTLLEKVKEFLESNESRRVPKPPKGSRDFGKGDMVTREKVFSIVKDVFKRHGAMALDTPAFELRETLMGKLGEDSKLIYDLADQVKLNHRKLLDGTLGICGVPAEKFRTICSSIDKLDKQTFEQIREEMVNIHPSFDLQLYTCTLCLRHFIRKLKQDKKEKFLENEESLKALNELEILFKLLERSKCIDKVVFDLSLARGLDYYTGVIFEAVFKGEEQVAAQFSYWIFRKQMEFYEKQ
ncbi:hypothetical protein C3L33_04609, partial [Rhododendron williamsianum]